MPQRQLRVRDAVDNGAIDVLQVLATQVLIEPTKLCHILLGRRLVRVLLEPSHHRIVPSPSRPLSQLGDAPQLRLEPVVKLLR